MVHIPNAKAASVDISWAGGSVTVPIKLGFGLVTAAGRTYSWSVADSFGTFINTYDNGAGTQYYQPHGSQGNYVPSGIAKGDPVLYILQVGVHRHRGVAHAHHGMNGDTG